MNTKRGLIFWFLWVSLYLAGMEARAEKVYFLFDGVFFKKEGSVLNLQHLHGYFSWDYTPGNFENGTGTMRYLDIPGTAHDHTDLAVTFDLGSLEITLPISAHDDGVDTSLKLVDDLSPDGPVSIDTETSKFEIGGNGFYTGTIYSGRVKPFVFELSIMAASAISARVSWTPDYSVGPVLEQSMALAPTS